MLDLSDGDWQSICLRVRRLNKRSQTITLGYPCMRRLAFCGILGYLRRRNKSNHLKSFWNSSLFFISIFREHWSQRRRNDAQTGKRLYVERNIFLGGPNYSRLLWGDLFIFSHINLQFRWICLLICLHRNKINLEHFGNISYQIKLLLWYLNI